MEMQHRTIRPQGPSRLAGGDAGRPAWTCTRLAVAGDPDLMLRLPSSRNMPGWAGTPSRSLAPVPRPVLSRAPRPLAGSRRGRRSTSASTLSFDRCGVFRVPDHGPRGAGRRPSRSWSRSALEQRREGEIAMATVYNWQLGRAMAYPVRGEASALAVRLRLQHQPLHRLPDLHDGLQEHLDLLQGPGVHVVEQRRVEALRRLSAALGRQAAGHARSRQPRRQVWNAAEADGAAEALRHLRGQDDLRGGAESTSARRGRKRRSATCPPTPNGGTPTSTKTPPPAAIRNDGQYGGSAQLPEHRVWFFHLARICNHCTYPGCLGVLPAAGDLQAARRRHRADRPGALPRLSQVRRGLPVQEGDVPPHDPHQREVRRLLPADRGQGRDAQPRRRARPRPAACRPASARSACKGWSRSPTTAPGPTIPTNPLYFLIRERQVALPLYPQFGTEPNGFYIPPRWVPRGYLMQMFGPGVEHAIEQYSCPDRELLAVLQLFRAQRQILFRFEIEKGPKVAEIPVTHARRAR